jgi:hypothetical protein
MKSTGIEVAHTIIRVQTECEESKTLKINTVTSRIKYVSSDLRLSTTYPTEVERWVGKPRKIKDLDMYGDQHIFIGIS